MAKPPKQTQSASEHARILAGVWSKTEKRANISRQMAASKQRTHEKLKAFKQAAILAR